MAERMGDRITVHARIASLIVREMTHPDGMDPDRVGLRVVAAIREAVFDADALQAGGIAMRRHRGLDNDGWEYDAYELCFGMSGVFAHITGMEVAS